LLGTLQACCWLRAIAPGCVPASSNKQQQAVPLRSLQAANKQQQAAHKQQQAAHKQQQAAVA
jgi:hypothetical protein